MTGSLHGRADGAETDVQDGYVMFQISGTLQPQDNQYVHDICHPQTGEIIGTVRMRWAHKYGHRYGGVGVVTDGKVECVWNGDGGWVKVRIPSETPLTKVIIRDRLLKIPD